MQLSKARNSLVINCLLCQLVSLCKQQQPAYKAKKKACKKNSSGYFLWHRKLSTHGLPFFAVIFTHILSYSHSFYIMSDRELLFGISFERYSINKCIW